MNPEKRRKLEGKGWTVGTVDEFLGLSEQESRLVELKLRLAQAVKQRRLEQRIPQAELAKQMNSSQSRVAKIEANDASVSMDLLFKALICTGATEDDIARVISHSHPKNGKVLEHV